MRDRIGLKIAMIIFLVLCIGQACSSTARAAELPEGDICDPTARARSWTKAQKKVTRDRIWAACKRVGGSDLYCSFWMAAICREAWCGIASAVHTRGVDADGEPEYGLGALALSVKFHRGKWPGNDEDPAFCVPEVAFAVGHAIAWKAMTTYHAHNAIGIQAIFGGGKDSHRCEVVGGWLDDAPMIRWLWSLAFDLPERGRTRCVATPQLRHRESVCSRMQGCGKLLTIEDLGEEIPLERRRAWAIEAAASHR
jgi:hypothetical protein